jgi:hypothetical protein
MAINVTGRLFANGGGGGSGNDSAFNEGSPGNDGASTGGTGGPGVRNNGVGGNGGGQSNPSPGNPPIGGLPRTPGGGGSVGFLQTYTPNGVTPMLNPTAASPSLQPNLEARTR